MSAPYTGLVQHEILNLPMIDELFSAKMYRGYDLKRKEATNGIGQLHGKDIRRRL